MTVIYYRRGGGAVLAALKGTTGDRAYERMLDRAREDYDTLKIADSAAPKPEDLARAFVRPDKDGQPAVEIQKGGL